MAVYVGMRKWEGVSRVLDRKTGQAGGELRDAKAAAVQWGGGRASRQKGPKLLHGRVLVGDGDVAAASGAGAGPVTASAAARPGG